MKRQTLDRIIQLEQAVSALSNRLGAMGACLGEQDHKETGADSPVPVKVLVEGHTLEQWNIIAKRNYICEFYHDGAKTATMSSLQKTVPVTGQYPFQDAEGNWWQHCQLYQMEGHIQPHFGGRCPVGDDTKVLVVYQEDNTGEWEATRGGRGEGFCAFGLAKNFNWGRADDVRAIVEYVWVSGVAG